MSGVAVEAMCVAKSGRGGFALSSAGLQISFELNLFQTNGTLGVLTMPDTAEASATSVRKRGLDSRQEIGFDIGQEMDNIESEIDSLSDDFIYRS